MRKLIFAMLVFIFLCLYNSPLALTAAKDSLLLWSNSVVPALFPFFIASQVLYYAGGATFLARFTAPLMRIFSLPAQGGYALVMSILCGYPTGSKICALMYEEKQLSGEQCRGLSVLCHTSGPVFICGTLASSLLGKPQLGGAIVIIHICAAFLTGMIFNFSHSLPPHCTQASSAPPNEQMGKLLAKATSSAISSILLICGYMVFFGIIIKFAMYYCAPLLALLPQSIKANIAALLAGSIEVTQGLSIITGTNSSFQLPLICFMLSFSGMCIIMQSLAFLPSEHINILYFLKARLVCAIIAFLLCLLYEKTVIATPVILTVFLCVSSLAYKTVKMKNSVTPFTG